MRMGQLSERLDSMTVRVTFPGGGIVAEIRGRNSVHVSFARGFYQRVHVRDLENRLAATAKLLWAAHSKQFYRILGEDAGQVISPFARPVTERDVEFHRRRELLIARGQCGDGRIRLAVRGMRSWRVNIVDDTLRKLPEREFTRRLEVAAGALIRDQRERVRELKVQTYDPAFVGDFGGGGV